MNGYPFINMDSWGYASGNCPDTFRNPVLGCIMRPAILIVGPWGYAIVQSAVTAFVLSFLSNIVLKRSQRYSFYLALFISGVGFYSGFYWPMSGH